MNETTISTYGLKKFMKSNICKAAYGWFYVVGRIVEYYVAGVTDNQVDDCYTDDLAMLKSGNVDWQN